MGGVLFPAFRQVRHLARRARGVRIAVPHGKHLEVQRHALSVAQRADSHLVGLVLFVALGAGAPVRPVLHRGVVRMAGLRARILVHAKRSRRILPSRVQIVRRRCRPGPGDFPRVAGLLRVGFRQRPLRRRADRIGFVVLHLVRGIRRPDFPGPVVVPSPAVIVVPDRLPAVVLPGLLAGGLRADRPAADVDLTQDDARDRDPVSFRHPGPHVHVQAEVLRAFIQRPGFPAHKHILIRRFRAAGQVLLRARRNAFRRRVHLGGHARAGITQAFPCVDDRRQFLGAHGVLHAVAGRDLHRGLQGIAGPHIHDLRNQDPGDRTLEINIRRGIDSRVVDDGVLPVLRFLPVPQGILARSVRNGEGHSAASRRHNRTISVVCAPLMPDLPREQDPDRTRLMRFLSCQDDVDLELHADFRIVAVLPDKQPVRLPVRRAVRRHPLDLRAPDLIAL